ncbi:tail fiber assembly protein [Neisseria sp. Ec49-e6-T10]|uniref:tail fiber assembly protein n=1 Tax=Neisseria sp. Ec49-e6-T10 TaxID=3140744 RepID=UPI003EBD3B7D
MQNNDTKAAFQYDPKTGQYLSTVAAYLDPMATQTQKENVYILPANATFVEPIKIEEFFVSNKFNGMTWELVEDYSNVPLWSKETAEQAEPLVFGHSLPETLTIIKPLAQKEGFAVQWQNDNWDYIADHRGKAFYSKSTGDVIIISELGDIPNTLTDQPMPDYIYVFSDKENKWVIDPQKQLERLIQDATVKKSSLLADAEAQITVLERAVKRGKATAAESELLENLYDFTIDISRINPQQAQDINWPEMPTIGE